MAELHWDPPAPGPWMADKSHVPYMTSRVLPEFLPPNFARGFGDGFALYGVLLDRVQPAFVNNFMYVQPQPFDMPGPDGPKSEEWIHAEFGRRLGVAAEALDRKVWFEDLALWDNERKPRSVARHRELHARDLGAMSDAQLVAELRERGQHVGDMVYQHHRFNASALFPIGDFALQIAPLAGADPVSLLKVLDGSSPVSGMLAPELVPAVAAVKADPEALALVHGETDAAGRLTQLRTRVPAVAEWLAQTEFRIVDGLDVTRPTLAELPSVTLGKLAAALEEDPTEAEQRGLAFAASVRATLAPDHHARFDELLHSARTCNRLRDERGMYSDTPAVGLLRLAMLEAGRRLASQGRLTDPTLAVEASLDELAALLGGASSPTAADLVARGEMRRRLGVDGAPALLGPPPPPPPSADELPPPLARVMSALGFAIDGVLGSMPEPAGDGNVIGGIGVGHDSYEGIARVVVDFDDLFDLEEGEVLVTPATMESFNSMLHLVGAIVTDFGSFVSHAAIMARELGFPTVVGTLNATKRIKTGDRVRVDPSAATVTVIK